MDFKIQEIVWAIEEIVTDYKNNKRVAVQIFRDAKCLRDDFRSYSIVADAFNFLTYSFCKHEGEVPLTNSLVKIGEITAKTLDINKIQTNRAIQLGSLIIEALIDNGYITLHREEYMSYEQLIEKDKKVKVRFQPYHIEIGSRFKGIKFLVKERIGISARKYPKWDSNKRVVLGVEDRLVKGVVKVDKSKPYLKAVNNIEQVRWEVNPKVAEISNTLTSLLIDSSIRLRDKDGSDVQFEARDIKREHENKEYKDVDLYHNDILFEPHLGNSSQVKVIEIQMVKLEKQAKKVKSDKKRLKEITKQISKCAEIYEKKNRQWQAKQLCLRTQSKSNRDEFILNTIHGTKEAPGWIGYKFYLASFLDFRGRMYARDPYFSYQSSDLARGHLMFAEKKVMTDKGYKHLLIHIANSYNQSYTINQLKEANWIESDYIKDLEEDGIPDMSVDKMTLQDRINWSEYNLDVFLGISLDPIEDKEAWMSAEKPWVFLSLCFEVVQYLVEDGDYYSQIPIAIDGSVNGTQHLAAMSKDEIAGAMVGLIPQEKPIDFYIVVAKGIINSNIDNDLGEILAKIPMKLIRKGISKRGTMTKAYDAGVRCISNIIYTDCYDAGMTAKYNITRSVANKLAKDLVSTYNSLCSGPVAVKNYLQALTKYRIKELGYKSAQWETPSGFEVVAEKWSTKKKRAVVSFCKKRIDIIYREITDVPSVHEITSGISPNYVHSMDAAHMSLVINQLHEEGITSFGAIHDSFSVHADDVDQLLEITKSVFISIYNCDVFKDMKSQFIGMDDKFDVLEPKSGSLDLEQIKDSKYFFC
jgi:hypothetical protein